MRLALLIFVLGILPAAQAETVTPQRIATTMSYPVGDDIKESMEGVEPSIMPALDKYGYREEGRLSAKSLVCDCDASIYDVRTILLSDFDDNGFYHRFKVIIDADTQPGSGLWVYAKLYLSFEGGPWNHYATSGDFFVEGRINDDEFVVETELVDGYPTGYYDIKLELFDAEHEVWLLDYGPYDDRSLSAVPLEDRDRDDYYAYVSAGSTQAGFLVLLMTLGLIRLYYLVSAAATGKPALRQPRKPSA